MRAIDFAPLTSSNLGRLQQEGAREQGSPQGSPPHLPVRLARHTLAQIDKVQQWMPLCMPHAHPRVSREGLGEMLMCDTLQGLNAPSQGWADVLSA